MKQVVTVKGSLKIEERNLLSVAYKNVVGSRRSSWRVLSSLLEKSEDNSDYIEEYKKKIEDELNDICTIVIVSIIINYEIRIFLQISCFICLETVGR